ncbi:AbrB/MazE/SpoVT family DNA-binding domain-containing protein [Candidatus Peregrinibacteria bacterium]|nr:AbrB/MazE/SpoVT family DNA-binding domain-containing protein [Candidatus Peregrinibacteria bacterium]
MKTANIFLNGNSQAIRLPKEFRFEEKEVCLTKIGKIVMIMPKKEPLNQFLQSLDEFSEDFLEDRKQPPIQKRKKL